MLVASSLTGGGSCGGDLRSAGLAAAWRTGVTAPGGELRSACLGGGPLTGAVEGAPTDLALGAALGVDFGVAGWGCRLLGACCLNSVGDTRPRGAWTLPCVHTWWRNPKAKQT